MIIMIIVLKMKIMMMSLIRSVVVELMSKAGEVGSQLIPEIEHFNESWNTVTAQKFLFTI